MAYNTPTTGAKKQPILSNEQIFQMYANGSAYPARHYSDGSTVGVTKHLAITPPITFDNQPQRNSYLSDQFTPRGYAGAKYEYIPDGELSGITELMVAIEPGQDIDEPKE